MFNRYEKVVRHKPFLAVIEEHDGSHRELTVSARNESDARFWVSQLYVAKVVSVKRIPQHAGMLGFRSHYRVP